MMLTCGVPGTGPELQAGQHHPAHHAVAAAVLPLPTALRLRLPAPQLHPLVPGAAHPPLVATLAPRHSLQGRLGALLTLTSLYKVGWGLRLLLVILYKVGWGLFSLSPVSTR